MRQLFAKITISFIMAILLLPFFSISAKANYQTPEIKMSIDSASANPIRGDSVIVSAVLNGTFSGSVNYLVYVSETSPEQPTAELSDDSVWTIVGNNPIQFASSLEGGNNPILNSYDLPPVQWFVDGSTEAGIHWIKTVATDSGNNIISSDSEYVSVKSAERTVVSSVMDEVVQISGDASATIKNNIAGGFSAGEYTYKIFVAGSSTTSLPSDPLTEPKWYKKGEQTFTVTEAEAALPIPSKALDYFYWNPDPTGTPGKRFIQTVIYNSAGTEICRGVTSVVLTNSAVDVSIKADGNDWIQYDMDTQTAPINIVTTMTPANSTLMYMAELLISIGFPTEGNHSAEPGAIWPKDKWLNLNGTQTKSYSWTPVYPATNVGIHQILVKVYNLAGGDPISTKSIWIKLCKGTSCGTTAPPPRPSNPTPDEQDLGGAAGEAIGYDIKLTKWEDIQKFIQTTWLPTLIGIFAFFGVIYSGWMYITSAGDQAKADKGKKGLLYTTIGIGIAVGAIAIEKVVKSFVNKYKGSTHIVGTNSLFEQATNDLATISGMLAFIYLVYSGVLYLTSSGNPDNAKKGLQGVINAAIGIVIIVAAWAIIRALTGTFNNNL